MEKNFSSLSSDEIKNLADEIKSRPFLTNFFKPAEVNTFICPNCGSGTHDNKNTGIKVMPDGMHAKCFACGIRYSNIDAIAVYLGLPMHYDWETGKISIDGKDFIKCVEFGCRYFGIQGFMKNEYFFDHFKKFPPLTIPLTNKALSSTPNGKNPADKIKKTSGQLVSIEKKKAEAQRIYAESLICPGALANYINETKFRGLSIELIETLKWGFLRNARFTRSDKQKEMGNTKGSIEIPAVVIPNDEGGIFTRAVIELPEKNYSNYRNYSPMATTTLFLPSADSDSDNDIDSDFTVFIVEGAINGASILQAVGFNPKENVVPNFGIISIGGISNIKLAVKKLLALREQGRKFNVAVALDNDSEAKNGAKGPKAAAALLKMLNAQKFTACIVDITKIPDVDLNDALQNYGEEALKKMVDAALIDAQEKFDAMVITDSDSNSDSGDVTELEPETLEDDEKEFRAVFSFEETFWEGFTIPSNYIISIKNGITEVFKDPKTGNPKYCLACRRPIFITAKFFEVDSKTYKLVLTQIEGNNNLQVVPPTRRSTIFNSRKLIDLSDYGLNVTSENCNRLVKFLDAFFNANVDKIPLIYTARKLGWQTFNDEEFFLDPRRDCTVEVDGVKHSFVADSQNQFSQYLKSKGELAEWQRIYGLIKDKPVARLMVAASVAAPLLKILGERNFLLYVYANTRAGKTTALLLGVSAVGSENLLRTFDATKNGLIGTAAAANDYLFAVDEKQAADKTISSQLQNLVYSYGGGIGRAKMNKDSSLRSVDEWCGIALMTGETPLLEDNATGGANTRTIQLSAPSEIIPADICADIRKTIKKNYGLILPLILDKISEFGADALKLYFEHLRLYFEEQDEARLQEYCRYIAVAMLADFLLNSVLGVDDATAIEEAKVTGNACFEFIPTAADISDTDKEIEMVLGFIAQYQKCFHNALTDVMLSDMPAIYGKFPRADESYVYITVAALKKACIDANMNYQKVVADLIADGFFIPSNEIQKRGKTPRPAWQVRIGNTKTRAFQIPAERVKLKDQS